MFSLPRETSFCPSNDDRVYDLPVGVVPVFFPSTSKGDECWWGTQDLNTVYLWDLMDNEDRQDSLETLREKDNWVPERTAGAIKSRDGDGEETSKTQNAKKQGNTV
jgi:hypothetical protein